MIRNVLRSFGLRSKTSSTARGAQHRPDFPPPSTEQDVAVIADVHGMLRPFEALLQRLAREVPQARVVCVGDLIDRGDQSADVLRLAFECRDTLTVIMGNHEEMLLRFLDDPAQEGARWFRYGGLQTLASFGISPPGAAAEASHFNEVRDRLRAAIGPQVEAWVRRLPRHLVSGNIAVTHAGADPWLPISQQSDTALTWGHPDFGRRNRTDGLWIVHGHVIVHAPVAVGGVISIDTGAYAGGGLTAAVISADPVRFFTE